MDGPDAVGHYLRWREKRCLGRSRGNAVRRCGLCPGGTAEQRGLKPYQLSEDEQRLVSLVAGMYHMLDPCEETMLHTSRSLLCWLRSTKPQTCYQKPCALVSLKASKTKYRRYFKRFIAFVSQAHRMPPDTRRALKIRLKKKELSQLQATWEHGAWDNGVLDWGLHALLQGEAEREEEDRFMVYLTRHHKAKRSNNREFYGVHFLPARRGRVMYKYPVYILPFPDMLQRVRDSYYKEVMPTRLFRSGRDFDRPWDAARLTAILRKATTEVWGRPVNSQLYRQLTIGTTEKHGQEVHKPFNRFDDVKAGANRNVAFAWQSGHRPLQRATAYGLDGGFPAMLQPALLRLYEWASTRWHEFLHQPSKAMPRARSAAVQKRARSPSPPLPQLPDARPRPVKRKTLPWSGDEPHETRLIKRSVRPGRQAPLGVNNVQWPLSKTRFKDDPDESDEVDNPLIDSDRPRQDGAKYPLDVIVSGSADIVLTEYPPGEEAGLETFAFMGKGHNSGTVTIVEAGQRVGSRMAGRRCHDGDSVENVEPHGMITSLTLQHFRSMPSSSCTYLLDHQSP